MRNEVQNTINSNQTQRTRELKSNTTTNNMINGKKRYVRQCLTT